MKDIHDYKVGDDIYLPSEYYVGHGADDFHGGLCEIVEIDTRNPAKPMIRVAEQPGLSWTNLAMLIKEQDKLREQFDDQRGYMDPEEGASHIPEPF